MSLGTTTPSIGLRENKRTMFHSHDDDKADEPGQLDIQAAIFFVSAEDFPFTAKLIKLNHETKFSNSTAASLAGLMMRMSPN